MNNTVKQKKYVVSLSFSNYLMTKSGIPKVMMAHQLMYNKYDIGYVSLFAVKKCAFHDKLILFCKFGLIINGEFVGIYQMSQIIQMMLEWEAAGKLLIDVHIHHFMYIKSGLLEELLKATGEVPIKIYLHDYYLACTNYTLIKNGRFYCGATGLGDPVCEDCVFHQRSVKREKILHALIRKYIERIQFVAPSDACKDIFLSFHPEYRSRTIVIPHQTYRSLYKENLDIIGEDEKIRIGFLGRPVFHKGWNVFQHITETAPPDKYDFYVFNSYDDQYEGIRKVNVAFTPEQLNAMTDALRAQRVHAVVLWALWPETYSYTCFEAFSANAFLLSSDCSGNIRDVIEKHQNGIVFRYEDELIDLIKNPDELKNLINSFRKSAEGGPQVMEENVEIVKISMRSGQNGYSLSGQRGIKIVNYPLLTLLNRLYQMKET